MKRIVFLLTACLLSAVNVYAEETFCDVVKEGSPSDVRKAIKNGADVNKKDQHGTTPLKLAVGYNKNPEVIQVLLDAGADVNGTSGYGGSTALMSATYGTDNPVVMKMLIDAGADVNAEDGLGRTALMYATIQHGSPEEVKLLLDAGADVNAKDKLHVTALMSAAYQNEHPEVLELLLDAGADVKVESGKGMTAWDYIQGNEALVGTDAYLKLKELSN